MSKRMGTYLASLAILCLFLTACTFKPVALPTPAGQPSADASTATATATEEGPPSVATKAPSTATTAADYCLEQGGQLISRRASYGTDGDAGQFQPLHGARQFCQFGEGDSLISLDVNTLWSSEPTLATLAYYEPVPLPRVGNREVSAADYCTQLGGTSIFEGVTRKPGAWVTDQDGAASGESNSPQVVSYCLFPDNSSIDQTGLISHTQGATLGIDLRTVINYRPDRLPVIYPNAQPYESTAPGYPALTVTPNPTPEADSDASAYCQEQGGEVILRTFYFGTNGDPSQWLLLATPVYMCEFDAKDGSSADPDSHIAIDLETLYSEEPTLAAMAYRQMIPLGDVPSSVNPATVYCSQIGGSSSPTGPENASGGGWVSQDQPVFTVMAMCVFADGSMIDEWGLTYHTDGAIRGADLSEILRY